MIPNTNALTPELDAIEDQDAQGGCLHQACSPVSETPETDAALVDHMPKDATEWSKHYLALSIHARKLERERNAARIPICIGRPIIEILANEGMWISMNGNSVVAADGTVRRWTIRQGNRANNIQVQAKGRSLVCGWDRFFRGLRKRLSMPLRIWN